MKPNETKTSLTKILIFILLISAVIMCFISHENIKKSIINGMNDCFREIIPTLFPFIFLSSFFVKTGIPVRISRLAHNLLSRLFGLSGIFLPSIIAGLCGGYNVASKTAEEMYGNSLTDSEQAKRLMLFFTSPGISFSIFFAGISVYNSAEIGLRFWISSVFASVFSAILYNLIHRNNCSCNKENPGISFQDAFVQSVSSTSSALMGICSYILLFSFLRTLIPGIRDNSHISFLVNFFSEITNSVRYTKQYFNSYYTVFALSFGGICIILQQMPCVVRLGIKLRTLILTRFSQSILSAVIYFCFNMIFPYQETMAVCKTNQLSYHSPQGSLALIFMLVIFVIYLTDYFNNKQIYFMTKKYNNRTCP